MRRAGAGTGGGGAGAEEFGERGVAVVAHRGGGGVVPHQLFSICCRYLSADITLHKVWLLSVLRSK